MPAGQPLDPRAPERPTVAGMARSQQRAQSLTDRRLRGEVETEARVKFIGEDEPPHRRGRLYLRPRNPES